MSIYVRELGRCRLRVLGLHSTVHGRGNGVLADEVTVGELDLARHSAFDRLPPTPCTLDAAGRARDGRLRAAVAIRITKCVRIYGSR
jgi:hypothetical protein